MFIFAQVYLSHCLTSVHDMITVFGTMPWIDYQVKCMWLYLSSLFDCLCELHGLTLFSSDLRLLPPIQYIYYTPESTNSKTMIDVGEFENALHRMWRI